MAKLYFGAGSALNTAVYSYILPESFESKIIKGSKLLAEYQALINGLEKALSLGESKLLILGPKLVIDQLEGITPVKSPKALAMCRKANTLLLNFRKVSLKPSRWRSNIAYVHSIRMLADFLEGKAIARSKNIPDNWIRRARGLKFDVKGYTVDLGREKCNCSFFSLANSKDVIRVGRTIRCEHIFAAEKYISR